MDCITYVETKYYSQGNFVDTLKKVNEVIDKNIFNVSHEMLCVFHDAIHTEPIHYFNKDVYQHTIKELEKLLKENPTKICIDDEMLECFFNGYNTFRNITTIIRDLSKVNFNHELKNQLYRFPTYTSIVEGCISNFFRFIVLFLNQITSKDLASQTKLGHLCDALNANNFQSITSDVNVDIRNSINHGKAIYKVSDFSSDIDFHYSKGNSPCTLTISVYEFDRIIDKAYDTSSAILLGICAFLNNHLDLIATNRSEKLNIPFQLFSLSISIPDIRCLSINGLPENKQINIDMYIKNSDRTYILQTAVMLSILTFKQYNDYQQYMISFSNERLQGSWIRFTNQEVKDMFDGTKPFDKTVEEVINRGDCLIWDASTEDIDLQEVKYFRFPNHSEHDYKINDIEDASIGDRKRLRAHLFIGDIFDKDKIVDIINRSIAWLKNVKNPPSPTIPHKYGEVEADSLYINVYRNDVRGDKGLLPNNENFVCAIDYNANGETTLKHGGIPNSLWTQLHHEKIGNIEVTWREGKYVIRKSTKVEVNAPCPCGSGKKYKKCCRD